MKKKIKPLSERIEWVRSIPVEYIKEAVKRLIKQTEESELIYEDNKIITLVMIDEIFGKELE